LGADNFTATAISLRSGTELRKLDDGTRTAMMFEGAEGKRLNYKQPAAGGARSMESRMGAASAAFMADAK